MCGKLVELSTMRESSPMHRKTIWVSQSCCSWFRKRSVVGYFSIMRSLRRSDWSSSCVSGSRGRIFCCSTCPLTTYLARMARKFCLQCWSRGDVKIVKSTGMKVTASDIFGKGNIRQYTIYRLNVVAECETPIGALAARNCLCRQCIGPSRAQYLEAKLMKIWACSLIRIKALGQMQIR
uniref:Uncharacterized protein n=1 Tax=Spironucleus salmonicida TaxID=348837 RepID=V6M0U8_9EUKA|eukprot:EST46764.1 Hypothetical protein SS50377_13226 [Spironucleus salmonicida]